MASSSQHDQNLASTDWEVIHLLGYYPNVTTVNTDYQQIFGEVEYVDPYGYIVHFIDPQAGHAFSS